MHSGAAHKIRSRLPKSSPRTWGALFALSVFFVFIDSYLPFHSWTNWAPPKTQKLKTTRGSCRFDSNQVIESMSRTNESNQRIASRNRVDELNQQTELQNDTKTTLKDPLKTTQNPPKTVPRGPKSPQERPKTPPRPSEEGPRAL